MQSSEEMRGATPHDRVKERKLPLRGCSPHFAQWRWGWRHQTLFQPHDWHRSRSSVKEEALFQPSYWHDISVTIAVSKSVCFSLMIGTEAVSKIEACLPLNNCALLSSVIGYWLLQLHISFRQADRQSSIWPVSTLRPGIGRLVCITSHTIGFFCSFSVNLSNCPRDFPRSLLTPTRKVVLKLTQRIF